MEKSPENTQDYKDIIGMSIKNAITDKGFSQTSFAEKMEMPISQVNRYCLGKAIPSPEIFEKIAKALDLSTSGLLYYNYPSGEDYSKKEEANKYESLINLNTHNSPSSRLEDDLKAEVKTELKTIENNIDLLVNHFSDRKAKSILNMILKKLEFIKENIF